MSDNTTGKLLANGVADAVGFVGGALLGFWAGQWLGVDIFAPGYGTGSLIGIALGQQEVRLQQLQLCLLHRVAGLLLQLLI